jgi:hypothetical protein
MSKPFAPIPDAPGLFSRKSSKIGQIIGQMIGQEPERVYKNPFIHGILGLVVAA